MTWLGWYLLGLITGVALAAFLVACVGRGSRERGGTLAFDSPEARGVFKQRGDASPPGVWVAPRDGDYAWDGPTYGDLSVPGPSIALPAPGEYRMGDDPTYADIDAMRMREPRAANPRFAA